MAIEKHRLTMPLQADRGYVLPEERKRRAGAAAAERQR